MKALLVQLVMALGKAIVDRLMQLFTPTHHEGGSDGTTEKKLRKKVIDDGWEINKNTDNNSNNN